MPPGMVLIVTLRGSNYRCRTNFHGPKGVRAIEVRLYRELRPFICKQIAKLIFDSVEEYARRWPIQEDIEVDPLSDWIKVVLFSERERERERLQ